MTIIGCMIPETWSVMDTEFFVILDHFLPFYSPNNPKDKNFVRLKKMPRDIIIWHKCTKNHDHILYRSLDMAHNKFNYFSFWANFSHFTSLTAQKIKIKKKNEKKAWRYHHFTHKCTKNHNHMLYCCWDMACDKCTYFLFWDIFLPF